MSIREYKSDSDKMPETSQADRHTIDQCLPQTQCSQCGFPNCIEYADALEKRLTDINRCPPGGTVTIKALAKIFNTQSIPLANDCQPFDGRKIAKITEAECIGCTLCIEPCPTDAIIGTAKHMHSVVDINCTGCSLCVDYCPVDCIDMVDYQPLSFGSVWPHYESQEVKYWRNLAQKRRQRKDVDSISSDTTTDASEIRQQIREAVNRERTKRWKNERKRANDKRIEATRS